MKDTMRVLKLIYRIYKIHCSDSLYESITVHDKIYNTNLLLNLSSVWYSEVNGPERSLQFFTTLYMCQLYENSVFTIANSLFTNVHKVQHCTGYPLIQVEIVSIKVTMCAGWLPKVLC